MLFRSITDIAQFTDNGLSEDLVPDFLHWLIDDLGVATKPRLIQNGAVTGDWVYLATHFTVDLLVYLRDNEIPPDQLTVIRQTLSTLQVQVKGSVAGATARLRDCCLPTAEVLNACPDLNFADLPDPEHRG